MVCDALAIAFIVFVVYQACAMVSSGNIVAEDIEVSITPALIELRKFGMALLGRMPMCELTRDYS